MFVSRRICASFSRVVRNSKRFQHDKKELAPIALRYMYGNSNKVQGSEKLEDPEDLQVEGILEKVPESRPTYPFSIFQSLKEAKEATKESEKAPKADVEEVLRHGTSDPSIKSSKVPCPGCGAHLHCQDSKLPGFIPYEMFSKIQGKYQKLRITRCQRCVMIEEYNVALKMNIQPEEYPKAISHLKNQKAIVVLIVDLMDFPGSLWPNILDLIGSDKRVILVGNKVDLLAQDSYDYLENVKKVMVKTFVKKCQESLDRKPIILDSILVSARTGYNIEWLITKIFSNWRDKEEQLGGDVYLVGTTNVGKSSIFNHFLDSDLCDARALTRIDKATIAPVPGTTLNLLKFPITRPEPGTLSQRYARLKKDGHVIKNLERQRISNLRKYKSSEFSAPCHPVGQTFWHKSDQSLNRLASTQFEMNMGDMKNVKKPEFHPKEYRTSKWCFDTPGTICQDQVINLFTQDEIMKIFPKLPILPRTFQIPVGQTIFVAGIGRLDVLQGPEDNRWSFQPLILTLFASDELPVFICDTDQAEEFYSKALKSGELKVPQNEIKRLEEFPALKGQEMEVYGISEHESACDIVLSSVGWFSVTTRVTLTFLVKAWTPGGKGIFLRQPSFLPFAVNLKGRRIRRTNYYEESCVFVP